MRILSALAALVAGAVVAFVTNPWPGAMLVRLVFDRGARKTTAALATHAPTGVASITDQRYRAGDDDAHLDIYFPEALADTNDVLPTVIWTHGGAWISGNRAHHAAYYQLIAAAGFTVISLDYSLAPGHRYPTAVAQLRDAHAYVLANAERLHVDPSRIVLAGDSAGAQLSSQLAVITTNPDYARAVGIESALRPEQLRGVILDCGIYEVTDMVGGPGIIGWGTAESIWAYTGSKDITHSSAVAEMSTLRHVTDRFPATFVSGGNTDGLTEKQSKALAEKLTSLGVDVTTLFYPDDHVPPLAHEYQFDLDNADGRKALEQTLEFLRKQTADSPRA
ncbi:alpha/beta hydrolase [Rhodococcus sp. ACT016]|uniref:alpha/beta hydrolase n=1 Tax=Rhodococcus sp. ACT016 TaxID=3134808 RepID=UPI003D2ABA40